MGRRGDGPLIRDNRGLYWTFVKRVALRVRPGASDHHKGSQRDSENTPGSDTGCKIRRCRSNLEPYQFDTSRRHTFEKKIKCIVAKRWDFMCKNCQTLPIFSPIKPGLKSGISDFQSFSNNSQIMGVCVIQIYIFLLKGLQQQ